MAAENEESAQSALGIVVSILAKIEKVWEQRLLSEKAMKEEPTTLIVEKQFKYGPEGEWTQPVVTEEKLSVHRYLTQPATVGCELGATLNMGNYEAARVLVSVTVPCYREEVGAAYGWAKDFVEERFKREVAEARSLNTSAKKKDSPF